MLIDGDNAISTVRVLLRHTYFTQHTERRDRRLDLNRVFVSQWRLHNTICSMLNSWFVSLTLARDPPRDRDIIPFLLNFIESYPIPSYSESQMAHHGKGVSPSESPSGSLKKAPPSGPKALRSLAPPSTFRKTVTGNGLLQHRGEDERISFSFPQKGKESLGRNGERPRPMSLESRLGPPDSHFNRPSSKDSLEKGKEKVGWNNKNEGTNARSSSVHRINQEKIRLTSDFIDSNANLHSKDNRDRDRGRYHEREWSRDRKGSERHDHREHGRGKEHQSRRERDRSFYSDCSRERGDWRDELDRYGKEYNHQSSKTRVTLSPSSEPSVLRSSLDRHQSSVSISSSSSSSTRSSPPLQSREKSLEYNGFQSKDEENQLPNGLLENSTSRSRVCITMPRKLGPERLVRPSPPHVNLKSILRDNPSPPTAKNPPSPSPLDTFSNPSLNRVPLPDQRPPTPPLPENPSSTSPSRESSRLSQHPSPDEPSLPLPPTISISFPQKQDSSSSLSRLSSLSAALSRPNPLDKNGTLVPPSIHFREIITRHPKDSPPDNSENQLLQTSTIPPPPSETVPEPPWIRSPYIAPPCTRHRPGIGNFFVTKLGEKMDDKTGKEEKRLDGMEGGKVVQVTDPRLSMTGEQRGRGRGSSKQRAAFYELSYEVIPILNTLALLRTKLN